MIFIKLLWKLSETATFTVQQECRGILAFKGGLAMNKDFGCCCGFLADMIIKYAPEIKEEVEMCMMIKDSIDDEKVSRQKQFDRFCYYLGGVKQLLDKKAA